jgi:hypothetical protein
MLGQAKKDPGPFTGLQTLHAAGVELFYHAGRRVFRRKYFEIKSASFQRMCFAVIHSSKCCVTPAKPRSKWGE